MANPIEDALHFAHARAVMDGDIPDWTPEQVLSGVANFCDEIRVIEQIISHAIAGGDVRMLARASAQFQFASHGMFGVMSSMITFTAGRMVIEGPPPDQVEYKGKYEQLFESLISLDLVGGDVDSGRSAARMTDMMHQWISESQDSFMYLMTAGLRDAGWDDDKIAAYIKQEIPRLRAGLLEGLDSELLELFKNSATDDDEK